MTTLNGRPTVLGLGTATLCPIDTSLSFRATSFAWRGDTVAFCTDALEGVVADGSLATGSVALTTVPCSGVTGYAGGILVQPPFLQMLLDDAPYEWYRDTRSLLRKEPDQSYPSLVRNDGAIGTSGDLLLSAWHATDTIDVLDLRRGTGSDSIVLERTDDWVQGLAGVPGDRIVLLGGISGDRLEIFSSNGAMIGTVDLFVGEPALGLLAGLACPEPARRPRRRLARIE